MNIFAEKLKILLFDFIIVRCVAEADGVCGPTKKRYSPTLFMIKTTSITQNVK